MEKKALRHGWAGREHGGLKAFFNWTPRHPIPGKGYSAIEERRMTEVEAARLWGTDRHKQAERAEFHWRDRVRRTVAPWVWLSRQPHPATNTGRRAHFSTIGLSGRLADGP